MQTRLSWRSPLTLVLVAGVALLGVNAWQGATATARTNIVLANPTTMGVVNLEALMGKLDEVKSRNSALQAKGAERQKPLTELSNKLEKIKKDLEMEPKDSKKRPEMVAEGVIIERQAQAMKQAYQQLIELDKGTILADIYNKMTKSCEALAAKQGVDLIIVDDSSIRLPDNGDAGEMTQAIQARRVLFAGKTIDVTDALATLMNNEFNAAGNAAAGGAR
ncbi:MAG: OmpH family outer membrane protein [Planctomycetota bacterium]|nr:OmpH family outer membrane protein [Planctomycetota bacterium]